MLRHCDPCFSKPIVTNLIQSPVTLVALTMKFLRPSLHVEYLLCMEHNIMAVI